MGDSLIHLPHNAQAYYRKGYRAIEAGDFETGFDYLEQSLALQFDIDVFTELIQACLSYRKTKQLRESWAKYMPDSREVAKLEFLSLLYMDSIEVMIEPKHRLLEYANFRENMRPYHQYFDNIDARIQSYQAIDLTKIKLINIIERQIEESYVDELLTNSQYHLLKKMKELYLIDLNLTLPIFKRLLLSEKCLQFIKSDILHHLIYQNIDEGLEILWFNQKRTVQIAELECYTEHSFYQTTLRLVEQHFEKEDPHLEIITRQYMALQAMVLFPFFEDCELTPKEWKNNLLIQLSYETVQSVVPVSAINPYLQKADAEIREIFSEGESIL